MRRWGLVFSLLVLVIQETPCTVFTRAHVRVAADELQTGIDPAVQSSIQSDSASPKITSERQDDSGMTMDFLKTAEGPGGSLRDGGARNGDPCKDFSCQFRPHSTCIVQDGIPTCACTMQCPSLLDPVVGSDNVMYMNECLMRMSACESQKSITALGATKPEDSVSLNNFPSTTYPPTGVTSSSGEAMDVTASPSAPCNGFSCDSPPYSKCVVQNDKPTCVCQLNCPNTGQPVLASDGAQYDNECLMQLNACSANKDITVVEFLPTSGPTNPGTTTNVPDPLPTDPPTEPPTDPPTPPPTEPPTPPPTEPPTPPPTDPPTQPPRPTRKPFVPNPEEEARVELNDLRSRQISSFDTCKY
ncbi:agrin isoform X2 [Nematostella vectensis]|uniref:agrin isoform X2 n=1 Tax=Nematostella vectensis TaxID=45351 RepID=UPI0020774304|nr:agrin isoform X2 [Nematostella vectensis]